LADVAWLVLTNNALAAPQRNERVVHTVVLLGVMRLNDGLVDMTCHFGYKTADLCCSTIAKGSAAHVHATIAFNSELMKEHSSFLHPYLRRAVYDNTYRSGRGPLRRDDRSILPNLPGSAGIIA
jgi:hypothetical protein